MLLYHFTSRDCLGAIMATGLERGTVAVSPTRAQNAVWFTTDPGPGGHGLEAGGAVMTDAQRHQAWEWSGVRPPAGTRFPKPSSVRIAVDLAPSDRNLHEWLPWARRNLAPDWLASVHPAGSNLRPAKNWRLYFGSIPAAEFVSVDTDL